ncbi:MAG: mechanosensitive ion channel, partial [Proteobacteria bacterium]
TISIGSTLGTVSRIQIRATTLVDADNLEVVVPNKSFITQSVQNWSLSSSITRIVVKVGVGYGCDPLEARRILLDVATANPNVLVAPAPSALFLGFGDSALQFELRAFVGAIDQRLSTLDALHAAVHRALGQAGIEIPFPQRDVYVHAAAAPEEAPAESAPVVDAAP